MVLQPLEFSDCFLDSPWLRSSIKEHEDELEKTNTNIKLLIKDAKAMLLSCKKQCESMHTFSERLKNFQFEIIGNNLTDAERGIAGSLKEFGTLLEEIEGEWSKTIERSEIQLVAPLERFRKDHIHSYREAKKTFDKSSDRYYKQMEHTLGLSHKKKEQQLKESDEELAQQKRKFHESSLDYIYKLQEVQERKKFEFVEHLLMFMQVYFNFFHQTHETANDCKDYMTSIQMSLVNTRSQYDGTREKTKRLMQKMMENPSADTNLAGQRWARAGYLYLLEKNALGSRSKWTRFFCMYTKENKLLQMTSPQGSTSFSSSGASIKINHSHAPVIAEPLIVMHCTRRATDSIDKRFCFDIEVQDTLGKQSMLTLQAESMHDRKKWISAMDGKEPDYILSQDHKKAGGFVLNEIGIEFVDKMIAEIERRGVDTEGIYRLVGVSSRVDRLLQLMMDPKSRGAVNYTDETEWEMTTLTSALKNYFRNLPEPIMTFELHEDLIAAAKHENPDERLKKVLDIVSKLSTNSKKVLKALLAHLVKVASKSDANKMPVQNIGVCFGPTLMRPKQETVQSIMEIKFNNIIVEIMIANYDALFGTGSLQGVSEKIQPTRTPIDSRPSMRKARPQRPANGRYEIIDGDYSVRFQRNHAIRAMPRKRISPGLHRRTSGVEKQATAHVIRFTSRVDGSGVFENVEQVIDDDASLEKAEDSPQSDNMSDDLGRISPLDLNLTMDFPLDRVSSMYTATPSQTSSVKAKTAKENHNVRRVHSQHAAQNRRDDVETSKNENFNNSRDLVSKSVASLGRDEVKPAVAKKPPPPGVAPKISVVKRGRLSQNKPGSYLVKSGISRNDDDSDDSSKTKEPLYTKPIKHSQRDPTIDPLTQNRGDYRPRPVQRPRASALSSSDSPTTQKICKPPFSPTGGTTGNRVLVALYSCEAEHESELSFEPGDVINNVTESDEPGWLIGTLDGVTGLIPANYVREEFL